MARLAGAVVEISDGRQTYFGTLIERGVRDEETGRYVVEINPDLAAFYGRSQWTQIDWEQRQLMRSKPLALWLHGFYASHAEPHALTVEYLRKLSGSRTKQLKLFQAESDPGVARLSKSPARSRRFDDPGTTGSTSRPCRAGVNSVTWPHAGLQLAGGNRHIV